MWGDIAIAFLLAFITTFVVTPHTMRLAKKVGAIDIPNDRRVNKKPMPRLRRVSSNCRFLCICNIFVNYNNLRRKDWFIWRRQLLYKVNRILYRNSNIRYNLLYRWFKRSTKFSKTCCTSTCCGCSCCMWY